MNLRQHELLILLDDHHQSEARSNLSLYFLSSAPKDHRTQTLHELIRHHLKNTNATYLDLVISWIVTSDSHIAIVA